jgi:hypothetical protein
MIMELAVLPVPVIGLNIGGLGIKNPSPANQRAKVATAVAL